MVYEMPCPDARLLFVSSDSEDRQQADGEIAHWAAERGWRLPQPERVFRLYRDGAPARDWRLLERLPA